MASEVKYQTLSDAVKIKKAVRARDKDQCVQCGMSKAKHVRLFGRSMDVHRVEPGKWYSLENCITLCKPCHGAKPKRSDGQEELVAYPEGFMVRLPEEFRAVLNELKTKNRRSVTVEVQIALEAYFKANGIKFPPT